MVLNQVIIQIDALVVEEMEEFVQTKVFLLFNKHVPQCAGSGEEITNPCTDCSGEGKQTTKKISVTIPKGVDDGTKIRLAGKGWKQRWN